MATLFLQIAGSAIGQTLGGPIGSALGSAIGGVAGRMIDQQCMAPRSRPIEGPRLSDIEGIRASEGAPIPRVYGRAKVGGQVIWATEFEEERIVERSGRSGGKSLGSSGSSTGSASGQTTIRYAYFANVAVALCEGPIDFVRRIWADGKPLDLAGVTMRFHNGHPTREPDPLIIAKQGRGDIPAFRGTAYVVFERLPLEDYGNRLPQFTFEVVRTGNPIARRLRAINVIPGATEFGYAPQEVREDFGYGNSRALNRTQWTHSSDWHASIDQLQYLAPGLQSATLINAWFGDDLRVGQCTVRPRVEKQGKITTGEEWRVAGLTRETAIAVSLTEGRPSYGGSPSDASVIAAIIDLRRRGLSITLHPFLLMDIPSGNGLPNPYTGQAPQPPFPWRGRITCDPAPGGAGSPEGSAALNAGIAAFFGTASSGHFSRDGNVVVYSGPDEWSYRRFVLHNAMLAQIAGGVECFYLGSELRGITHLSSGNGAFPAVSALIALASEVRAILGPATRITYAADWTEYGARVRDGGQEVRFPLDALWAHPEIGAVAIDLYTPVSDWRAGQDHLDAEIAASAADLDYLRGRIGSGEDFDWYYPDDAARNAQNRAAISDGAFSKPWVYRTKDLVGWWSQAHIERVGGSEVVSTAWSPRSKPIILAEIGCPAVDKGANQPNVFPDPKSTENALPRFSHGGRDDLIQTRLIEAYLDRFTPGSPGFVEAFNPVSPVYGGRMVMAERIAPWAWDSRPFPAFPDSTDLWSDGVNWSRGHWLNGRLEGVPVSSLLPMIIADHGHSAPLIRKVDGMVDGYVIDRPMSARAAIEPVIAAFGIQAGVSGATVMFSGPMMRALAVIGREEIVPGKDGQEIVITRREASDLPRGVALGFSDSSRAYRPGLATARKEEGEARRELAQETALVMARPLATTLAEMRLRDQWASRETVRFTLRPGRIEFETGDRIQLVTGHGPRDVVLTAVTDAAGREIEGRIVEQSGDDALPVTEEVLTPPLPPALPGAAFLRFLDLPIERGTGPVSLALRAEPWRGPYAVSRIRANGISETLARVEAPARIGTTLSALPPGPLWRWDRHVSLDLRLEGGALASLGWEAVLSGGNALALIGPDEVIEVVLFREAELVGSNVYRVSSLLRGLGSSEAAASRLLAAGADVVVLDNAISGLGFTDDAIGETADVLVTAAGRDAADPSAMREAVTIRASNLRPLAPVHPRARRETGGIRLTFIRRARAGGDNLDLYEVPLGEEREEYRLEILDGIAVRRSITLTSPDWLYSTASEIADFGTTLTAIGVRIRQVSTIYGPGDPCEALLPVN